MTALSDTDPWFTFGLDIRKFPVGGLGFGIVLLRQDHSQALLHGFGFSAFRFDMTSVDIIFAAQP